jgi:hypothetical protein
MRDHSTSYRGAMIQILHAIAWVFAIIIASSIWGSDVTNPMLVAYIITNGILLLAQRAGRRPSEE